MEDLAWYTSNNLLKRKQAKNLAERIIHLGSR
jgi:hypothetical protein